MQRFRFSQVNVFSDEPLGGNPLAVVHAADELDDDRMRRFARWTNLSETVFLLKPTDAEADFRVRIFTPGGELPFAGHPTLGCAHAWLHAGGTPRTSGRVVQQCGIGLIDIRVEEQRTAFAAPPMRAEAAADALLLRALDALGLAPERVRAAQWLDNGPRWLALLLESAKDVLAIEPDHAALKQLAKVGVVGPYEAGAECQFEVRAFASANGVPEDPVTGSFNASLGQWLIPAHLAPERYVASQGTRLGRRGRVSIEREGDTVWVGGAIFSCIEGTVTL